MTTETRTLLVCTEEVLARYRAVNGAETPRWASYDEVTDEQLASATVVTVVWDETDLLDQRTLLNRLRDLEIGNERIFVQNIDALEEAPARRAAAEEADQAVFDRRIEHQERAKRRAQRKLDAEELADDIAEPVVATFAEEAEAEVSDEEWVIEGLLPVEGRIMLSATKKSGKTTLVLNLLRAMVTGGFFLGLFPVAAMDDGKVTCWLNMELTRRQAQRWIKRLDLTPEQGKRLVAIHLRGAVSRFNLSISQGRQALVETLAPLNVQRLVVDPVAVLMAASGLNNVDDLDVARFMIAFDRIAAELGIGEVIYIHHVGKGVEEGKESAKGSTRWEDAVDAIWLMGFARESRERWFRAEGRDVEVAESPLAFDADTLELTVKGGLTGVGLSRRSSTTDELAKRVYELVCRMPGIKKGPLRGHPTLGVRGVEADAAIAQAEAYGWIRTERGDRGSIQHWPVTGS